jgi:hypothetical protein
VMNGSHGGRGFYRNSCTPHPESSGDQQVVS